jgi:hypothetical protein
MLRPTDNWPFCLGVKPHIGNKTRFVLLPDICEFAYVGRPVWRKDGCIVYICCWPSSGQQFSWPSQAGFITIVYCLRFESPTWRARSPCLYPPGRGWTNCTARRPFMPSHTTRRVSQNMVSSQRFEMSTIPIKSAVLPLCQPARHTKVNFMTITTMYAVTCNSLQPSHNPKDDSNWEKLIAYLIRKERCYN